MKITLSLAGTSSPLTVLGPIASIVFGEFSVAASRRRDRPKPPDSEKLTINLGFVDLGSIDLLVRDGFYSNRSDFIRTAIRNQLTRHEDVAKEAASRLTLELGLRTFARRDLEAVQAAGKRLSIRVLGLAVIADDVTPDLATATIESITVLGALHAPADVKAALADRLR